MPGNTKAIKKDVNAQPAPQYFNPTADIYEYLHGRNGANRTELYGPDGQPISTTSGKLNIRASELETALANILTRLGAALPAGNNNIGNVDVASSALPTGAATAAKQDALLAKDFATQTTLEQILAKIITAPATAAKQDTIAGHVDGIEDLLTAIKGTDGIKKIVDAVTADITDRAARVLGKVQIDGSFDTIRAMIGATKTATSVASEAFAGASRKIGRRGLWLKNENWAIRIHIDGPAITAKSGVAVEPFGSVIFSFDPAVDIPVYVISEAGNIPYGVVEW